MPRYAAAGETDPGECVYVLGSERHVSMFLVCF